MTNEVAFIVSKPRSCKILMFFCYFIHSHRINTFSYESKKSLLLNSYEGMLSRVVIYEQAYKISLTVSLLMLLNSFSSSFFKLLYLLMTWHRIFLSSRMFILSLVNPRSLGSKVLKLFDTNFFHVLLLKSLSNNLNVSK